MPIPGGDLHEIDTIHVAMEAGPLGVESYPFGRGDRSHESLDALAAVQIEDLGSVRLLRHGLNALEMLGRAMGI
jgi:hypothetical protein